MSFLTLEDINSVILKNQNNAYWEEIELTVATISDFTNIKFGFLTVNRTYEEGLGFHWEVSIDNSAWCGYYYIVDSNGNHIDADYDDFYSETEKVTYACYLSLMDNPVEPTMVDFVVENPQQYVFKQDFFYDLVFKLKGVGGYEVNNNRFDLVFGVTGGVTETQTGTCFNNQIKFRIDELTSSISHNIDFMYIKRHNANKKFNIAWKFYNSIPVIFNDVDEISVYVGKINKIELHYVSSIDFDLEIDCPYPISDIMVTPYESYYLGGVLSFNVDLTKEYTANKKFNLLIHSSQKLFNEYYFNQKLKATTKYNNNNLNELVTGGGFCYIKTSSTMPQHQGNIHITKDTLIVGEDNPSLMLRDYNLIIENGVTFKMENIDLVNVNGFIIQESGSNVEFNNCDFYSEEDAKVGNLIKCNIDLESLSNTEDFRTIFNNCNFYNIGQAIIHGGYLEVNNCNYEHTNGSELLLDYPFFLYQTDGEAIINKCSFEIENVIPQSISENHEITFAPCLFVCGEEAIVNGENHLSLQQNNFNSFLQNNKSEYDISYFYDLIEAGVTLNGNGFCHGVSGVDYVFKTNITITRDE